jgi:transcriptional regulator with XRE-family HTH domain
VLPRDSTAVQTSIPDLPASVMDVGRREVLACSHCRLVQFRARTFLCRRCHKPLDGEVLNPIEVEAAAMRSGPEAMDVLDPMKNLGVRVRDFRKERGLTQRVLACRMNVPRTYISKVEMGRVVPTLATLWRVAAALGVTVTDLLSDVAERRRDDEAARILEDPFLAEIAQVLDKLNAVHRALILRAVRDAAGNHRPAAAST